VTASVMRRARHRRLDDQPLSQGVLICDVGSWSSTARCRPAQTARIPSRTSSGSIGRGGAPEGWKQTDAPEPCEFEVGCETSIGDLDFGT